LVNATEFYIAGGLE